MSCHGRKLQNGGTLWICLSPVMGFTSPEEQYRRQVKLFGRKYVKRHDEPGGTK